MVEYYIISKNDCFQRIFKIWEVVHEPYTLRNPARKAQWGKISKTVCIKLSQFCLKCTKSYSSLGSGEFFLYAFFYFSNFKIFQVNNIIRKKEMLIIEIDFNFKISTLIKK